MNKKHRTHITVRKLPIILNSLRTKISTRYLQPGVVVRLMMYLRSITPNYFQSINSILRQILNAYQVQHQRYEHFNYFTQHPTCNIMVQVWILMMYHVATFHHTITIFKTKWLLRYTFPKYQHVTLYTQLVLSLSSGYRPVRLVWQTGTFESRHYSWSPIKNLALVITVGSSFSLRSWSNYWGIIRIYALYLRPLTATTNKV